MQLPVEYLLLRMGVAQQSLIAVRNEIMQACAQMSVEGTNVVALEHILDMCETTIASIDRTQVRLIAWKQIYPNHVGMLTSDHLAFDDEDEDEDGDWMSLNDDNDAVSLNNDALDLDDDDDDDALDLNDDDLYRDPEDKQREYTQDECDGYFLPLSSAQDNLPVTNNTLTDHEFALLFGLVPSPSDPVVPAPPLMYDIFGNQLPIPHHLPTPPHTDVPDVTSPDPDPDYNVPGSL